MLTANRIRRGTCASGLPVTARPPLGATMMMTRVGTRRDRAQILGRVAPSYFQQEGVSEIVFVVDAGTDDTPWVVEALSRQFGAVHTKIVRNPTRLGASQSRNIGVAEATNDFVLFCDDDEYLEPGYARTCLRKLLDTESAAVSGRRVYMLSGETPEEAVRRFGNGLRPGDTFFQGRFVSFHGRHRYRGHSAARPHD